MATATKAAFRWVLRCTHPGCSGAWMESDGARHDQVIRRARQRGWTGDGRGGCLCIERDIRCPDHPYDVASSDLARGATDEAPHT